jgi:hypothetical protein
MLLAGGIGVGGIAFDAGAGCPCSSSPVSRDGREYHVAAVGGSNDDEVSVDLADVLNALGAQDWELKAAIPLKDSDTLLLILSRDASSAATTGGVH